MGKQGEKRKRRKRKNRQNFGHLSQEQLNSLLFNGPSVNYFYFTTQPRLQRNLSERITMTCADLESLMNKLEPSIIINQHLSSLKQALFHSHTKVVQVAVKQFIRMAKDSKLAEKLSEDMEVVLGLIENLAHKEQRVTRDCVMVLLLLSSTTKSLKYLLCPDVTDVLKTIMTYVAVRLLVYEFIMQLSINSQLGLEKSHTCGILEDVINDFKKKESYLTPVHYYQLNALANTAHGRNYLVKYDALDCVSKQTPTVPRETMAHLVLVIPAETDCLGSTDVDKNKIYKHKNVQPSKHVHHKVQGVINNPTYLQHPSSTVMSPLYLDQIQQIPNSPSFNNESTSSLREVHLTSSSSSLSSPCDSLDSTIITRKMDDIRDFGFDSIGPVDRSFTPPVNSPTPTPEPCQEMTVLV